MKRSLLWLCPLLLAGCQGSQSSSAVASAGTGKPAAAPSAGTTAWNEAVIWDGELNACRQGRAQPSRDCLHDAMRAGGASAAALAAADQLSGDGELAYVTAWHEDEGVGVATIEYPFRANTNEGTRLVDAKGERIDVDALPSALLMQDPALQALLQAHPGATPFAPAVAAGSVPLQDGGVRLTYNTPMRQCHACPDVAQLRVAYDFDAQRNFIGQQVLATPTAP